MFSLVDSIRMPRARRRDERLDRLAFLSAVLADVLALVRALVRAMPPFVDAIRMTRTHRTAPEDNIKNTVLTTINIRIIYLISPWCLLNQSHLI